MEPAGELSERVQARSRVPIAGEEERGGEYAVRHSQISQQNVVRVFPQLAVRQQSGANESVAEKCD